MWRRGRRGGARAGDSGIGGLPPLRRRQWPGWRDGARATLLSCTRTLSPRMGRWSAQHRKKAIWGWLAFVVIAFVVGNAVGIKKPANQNDYIGQSGQAEQPDRRPLPQDRTTSSVLVQAPKGGKATDAAVRTAVDQTHRRRLGQAGRDGRASRPTRRATRARSPRTAARCSSSSRSSGDDDQTERARRPDRSPRSTRSRPTTRRSSSASSAAPAPTRRSPKSFKDDFKKAESLSLPITLRHPRRSPSARSSRPASRCCSA